MKFVKSLLLVLFLLTGCAICSPVDTPCKPPIGLIERAFDDARAALFIPALQTGVDLYSAPIQLIAIHTLPGLAEITVVGNKVVVLYDRELMEQLSCKYGYDAVVGVFGHELGHLLNELTNVEDTELNADTWAGCAMAVNRSDPKGYENLLASFPSGGTHPAASIRATATENGYEVCKAAMWE